MLLPSSLQVPETTNESSFKELITAPSAGEVILISGAIVSREKVLSTSALLPAKSVIVAVMILLPTRLPLKIRLAVQIEPSHTA